MDVQYDNSRIESFPRNDQKECIYAETDVSMILWTRFGRIVST